MITLAEYLGPWSDHPDFDASRKLNAARLLGACAQLESYAVADGVEFQTNPKTGSNVSGTRYGGFRPQSCVEGAPGSSHKMAMAVDRFDPDGKIDAWCMKNIHRLVECGIYIEHPSATSTWSHWTIRAPKSGRRAFFP